MQPTSVISLNIWQIVISLANLVIIFFIAKKFLYKRVRRMLDARKKDIDKSFEDAESAKKSAIHDQEEWSRKMSGAKKEADKIIQNAVETANVRGTEIVSEAKEKADYMVKKAESEIELERKAMEADVKKEIIDVSALLSEKVLGREINENDHRDIIDSVIDEIGEDNERK